MPISHYKEGYSACKKSVVGLLVVTIWLELCTSCYQLSSPPPVSLAPIKSRMVTFWFWLTKVCLEKCLLKWRMS